MTVIATWTCSVADLPQRLPAAIERMQAVEAKRGPCIVVAEKLTDRFVQLYGGFGQPVVVDVPVVAGAPNAACVQGIAAEFHGAPSYTWEGIDFYQAKFRPLPEGIELAALKVTRTLVYSLALPLDAELVVEELLSGMEKYSKDAVS